MVAAVLLMPLLIVSWRFCGALAVTVTLPGPLQEAKPVSLILAIAEFELLQLNPSAGVMRRLELSEKMPVAVKPTEPWVLADAVAGVTLMLFKLG